MSGRREGRLLRIYVGESDRHDGLPLHEWIVREARSHGLAGATVLRGLMGYGGHSTLHTAKILSLSNDLPVVIEIVDDAAAIEGFLRLLEGALDAGVATVEEIELLTFGPGRPSGSP